MPIDQLTERLQNYKALSSSISQEAKDFCRESPFNRTRREVRREIDLAEKYRAAILKNVATFAGLSPEAIITAAQSMEEIFYKQGDHIIEQDDIGDSFYVLEEGLLSVTRKVNSRDPQELPRELTQLKKNAHFGEISLLTAEPRSATITVISETAKCLRMTKAKFDDLLATTNRILAENRKIIGRDVLDTVPLFKSLTSMNKKKLLDVMVPMTYLPNSYICRQGTMGNTFYILTEGTCSITVNNDDKGETEIAKIRPGDFFGEVALIETSNKRTANVISIDTINCLTLSRTDFHRLLKNMQVKILEHQMLRSGGAMKTAGNRNSHSLSKKRRISAFDIHGRRDENRVGNYLKRFARFTTESLWNSLYARMYREMLLDPQKAHDYGKIATTIMKENNSRQAAISAIQQNALQILEFDSARRTTAENAFVVGVLKQRNQLKDNLCRGWPFHQFISLCRKAKILRVRPFRKIIEVDTRGTTAFLILRGCVRIFSRVTNDGNVGAGKNTPLYYEEDLFPGEIFGEAALGGMHTRLITAQTITEAELAVIDDQDFMMAKDKDAKHMAIEDRSKFLSSIPLFKNWDSYKLLRLAHALIQQEINKGVLLVKNGVSGKEVYFIVNGRVDVVDSMEKKNVITSLLKSDYVGETSLINKFVKSSTQKIVEECDAVAITKVDVLVLQETNFHLFDAATLDVLREGYFCKVKWRKERIIQSKVERAKVRKYQRMLSSGHDFPAINSPRETDSSERSLATSLFTITGLNTAKAVIAERASSPILNMPPSMKQKYVNQINTSAQVLLSDTINQVRISVGEKLKKTSAHAFRTADMQMLDDIEDIPELFSKEIDYLMIPQQQNSKKMEKVHETIKNGKLPKSARMKIRCAENLRESTLRQKRETLMNEIIRKFPGDKPFRSSVKIPSPISRPRTADTAVTLKAGELTKQGPNELQIQLNLPALSARPHTTQSVKLFKPDTMDSMDGYDIFKSLHENSAEYSANGDLLNRYLSSMGVDNEESSIGGFSLKLQGSSRIPHSKSYFESIGAAQDNVMDNLPLKISQSKLFSPKKKKSL